MGYSTDSETTKEFCKSHGFLFSINFVATMKRGDKVYVTGTAGKPYEWKALEAACDGETYIYKGRPTWDL
jgi:hypothetical protein